MSKGVAMVTGGSTGIGAVYADRLARRGYDILLVARTEKRLADVAGRLNARTECLRADLTREEDLDAVAGRLHEDAAITLLLNCAGVALFRPFRNVDRQSMDNTLKLNVVAVTRLAQAAAVAFSKRGRGTIINLASALGLAPFVQDPLYGATKAYILYLSQALNAELSGSGVHVQVVAPGATRTEIFERAGRDLATVPAERLMNVEELVDAALAGLDQGEVVTIPSLLDIADWQAYVGARDRLSGANSSKQHAAPRYGVTPV